GNTTKRSLPVLVRSVHPRWRGEHPRWHPTKPCKTGSSPLARGTLFCMHEQLTQWRFIPAGAGNTTSSRTPAFTSPVHPRWRGEHYISTPYHADFDGSSPLARG